MPLVIDFPNKIIKPDRADMTLIQSTPIEIYQLDLNTFHEGMRNLEDDEGGIWADVTHDYASPTTLSGVTYARLIEIINSYTVTFLPDSAWVVQIVGGNSNVGDRINPNNVSVQVSNSAGLQDAESLQAGSFDGRVTVDTTSSFTGTTFPTGTAKFPVNNLADARLIAEDRGLRVIRIMTSMSFTAGDFSPGYTFEGVSPVVTTVTLAAGVNITKCTFLNMTIEGVMDGQNTIVGCHTLDITFFNGAIHESALEGTITLSGGVEATIFDCWSSVSGGGPTDHPTIDMNGAGNQLALRGWDGGLGIENCSGVGASSLDFDSGRVTFDVNNTGGVFTIRGIADVFDNSAGATVNDLTVNKRLADLVDDLENRLVTVDNGNGTGTMTLYDDDKVTVLKSWTTVIEGSGAISERVPV